LVDHNDFGQRSLPGFVPTVESTESAGKGHVRQAPSPDFKPDPFEASLEAAMDSLRGIFKCAGGKRH
jgi:hypothetical protein